ncbi:Bug family tripartite tricarboxylate transporter substrate binding protein [Variovorax sp. LjRoot178]|uniref:Bug family tripartite tricarboxylate transporter substrate binding protein n=1 Tax=Variovorax sp. LjRoot178 TaxID=3342277 RepID=UPI003ECEB866
MTLLLALLASCLPSIGVAADEFPTKPVTLVVGFPPGGPSDVIGRVFARTFSEKLGTAVVVDNKGGANGLIAASLVAKQKPDGYTLLLAVEAVHTRGIALSSKLPIDPAKDFAMVGKFAKQRNMLVVHPGLPVKDVREFIEYLKARPEQVNYAGSYGASAHTAAAMFDLLNGTKMTFVSYPGGGRPIADLIAGVVQVGFYSESTVGEHVKAGKLSALATVADERSPAFPQLPTLGEAGAKPMDVSPWFGIATPAGLPEPVLRKLTAALQQTVASKEFVAGLEAIGASPVVGSTPTKFADENRIEVDHWKKFVQDAKFPLER